MRRGSMIMVGLLACVAALPQSASARSRHLPGLLGVITAPIGALLSGPRHLARHVSSRRHTVASRHRPAAAVAATGAAAATAAASQATPSPPPASQAANEPPAHPATKPATADVEPAAATPVSSPVEAPAPVTTASVPTQHAALTSAPEELQPAVKDRRHTGRPLPGSARLGIVGPLTWPSAFEDVIGYTLWPQQYAERLRGHGIADVLGAAFVSPATLAAKARLSDVQAKAGDAAGTVGTGFCGQSSASADWPVAEIERSVELDSAQKAALNELRKTIGDAITSIAATCRDTANLGPTERVQAMQATLWAVHDAALLIRAPLATFYDSLSDDQKKRFATQGGDYDVRTTSRSDMARMCGMPSSPEASMRQIERSLQVGKAQRASLDALNKRSFEMGQFLMASCLKPIPPTPTERLDNAADRLTAVLFAASNLGPAVNDFYNQLGDEQKSKLKSLK